MIPDMVRDGLAALAGAIGWASSSRDQPQQNTNHGEGYPAIKEQVSGADIVGCANPDAVAQIPKAGPTMDGLVAQSLWAVDLVHSHGHETSVQEHYYNICKGTQNHKGACCV
jgi:hypothetical protein